MQKNTETGKTRTVRVVPYPLDTRKSLVSLLRLRSGTWSRVTITHNRKALKEAWILDSNWYQRQMLDIKVRELKSRGYSTERQLLYHGCNATVAMDIALSGYHDMGSKNGRLWGHGVYFTSDVNLALDINYATPVSGIQTVLFCDVLVGGREKSDKSWRAPSSPEIRSGGNGRGIYVKPFAYAASDIVPIGIAIFDEREEEVKPPA